MHWYSFLLPGRDFSIYIEMLWSSCIDMTKMVGINNGQGGVGIGEWISKYIRKSYQVNHMFIMIARKYIMREKCRLHIYQARTSIEFYPQAFM